MNKYLKGLFVLPVVFSLVACSQSSEETKEENIDEIEEVEEVDVLASYGKKTNSSITYSVTNETKQDITRLSIASNEFLNGESIEKDENVYLYMEPVKDEYCDIQFTLADGSEYEIKDMDLNTYKTFSLIISKGKAYMTVNGKKIVSKKEVDSNKQTVLEGNYVHVANEDLIFPTFDQASSYAVGQLDAMYKKYNKPVLYVVDTNDYGKIVLSWYVQNYEADKDKSDEVNESNQEYDQNTDYDDSYIEVYTPSPSSSNSSSETSTETPPSSSTIETYSHVPSEDLEFSSFEEGVSYGNSNLYAMYSKYGKPVKFSVDRNSSGSIILSWYVRD